MIHCPISSNPYFYSIKTNTMSEFTNHREEKISRFTALYHAIADKKDAPTAIRDNQELILSVTPADVISVIDRLVRESLPIGELKTGINKFLNVLFRPLSEFSSPPPASGSFLDCCFRNNLELEKRLKQGREKIKAINRDPGSEEIRSELFMLIVDLTRFTTYYQIKENTLFPLLEQKWPDYRCLGVMWAFHDDIRKNLEALSSLLSYSGAVDLPRFNRLIGDLYFNMSAVRFREERILFPVTGATIGREELDALLPESLEIGFPYFTPEISLTDNSLRYGSDGTTIDLGTGSLTAEQIALLFNNLPVNITFVDENDKVRYFSTPAHRIFPRAKAILGRDVTNCHPPESIHVVKKIVENFREGKKNEASFWIRMKEQFILIRYFAIRDSRGNYKGVIEVSQEVSGIRQLDGQKRLLDWDE